MNFKVTAAFYGGCTVDVLTNMTVSVRELPPWACHEISRAGGGRGGEREIETNPVYQL